jgi:hypothetical protein
VGAAIGRTLTHHPLLAVLGEGFFLLQGWLRSRKTAAARGAEEFLKEGLAKLESPEWIRVVWADSERVATVSAVLTVGLFRARCAGPRAETK